MINTEKFLSQYLDESHINELGKAVCLGYKICNEIYENSGIADNFLTIWEKRAHLLTPCVEYALSRIEEFHMEFKNNVARNCRHARFTKNKLTITAHFIGRNGERKIPKKSLNKGILAGLNGDLFENENEVADISNEHAYCWLLHSGYTSVKYAHLALPNRSQSNIVGSVLNLPLIDVHQSEVEEVVEQAPIELKKNVLKNVDQG